MKQNAEAKARLQREHRFLKLCLLITGACTLILEIVGTRLISPYYGSSLYCWAALITVTLVALAGGYAWGGRLADRTPTLTLAAKLLAAAAVAVAMTPSLRVPALRITAPLGVQLGALASAAILVAPALVTLSALGPLAVRLLSHGLDNVGRSAGGAYAVSTIGSVAGAILASFVLVPNVPLSKILYATAIVLLALSTWAHHVSQRRLPLAQPAMAAALALFAFWPRPVEETNIVLNEESAYGQLKVLDFGSRRYLLVNGTTQSMAVLPDLLSDSTYAQAMELAAAADPKARRALVIGLGGGLMTSTLERAYKLSVDSVELDPAMARVAKSHFGFAPKGGLFIEDGRRFLERGEDRYDVVMLDAFGAESPPFHLFTAEAFAALRRRMNPGGRLAVNLVSALHGPESGAWRAAHRTLSSAFPSVQAFVASDPAGDLANVVFLCSDAPLPKDAASRLRKGAKDAGLAALARPLEPGEDAGDLMTDDFAPMESLMAATSLRWRKNLQKKIETVLLY